MKLDDLLKHPSLTLPKNWKILGYPSYYACVVNESSNFLNLLEELDDDVCYGKGEFIGNLTKDKLVSTAYHFRLMTINALQCYLNKGNPHETYNIIDEGLKAGITNVIKERNKDSDYKPPLFYLEFENLYPEHYRLREKQGTADLGDLFHVPFECRHNIASSRYSIPGYPTLYLSNSIFLAYKELREPEYDNLFVSKFRYTEYNNRTETLLDLTNRPHRETPEFKFKFLARWVLIMACSIEVGFPDSPFKPEYILPQILLQWVKKNINIGDRKVIGVTYSSTKIVGSHKGFYGYFYNTAIPIHSSNKEGYCSMLSKQFCMTQPISFHKALEYEHEVSIQGQVKTIEINGASVDYVKTDFGKIEQVLSETPHSELYYVNGKRLNPLI
jgi:hypothetical protein